MPNSETTEIPKEGIRPALKTLELVIDESFDPKWLPYRLDRVLSFLMQDYSRTRIQNWLKQNRVQINQEQAHAKSRIKLGDRIIVQIPTPRKATPLPEDLPLEILYEDSDLIVVNKAAGMVVHPAPGNYCGTLVNALLHHCGEDFAGIGDVKRPGIVHRIDKGTSGILVVAKSQAAHDGLCKDFKDHHIHRKYQLLTYGHPPATAAGTASFNNPIGRDPHHRTRMAADVRQNKNALTHYRILKYFKNASLVEAKLETGRTHQIRVHFSHHGYSLIGDDTYTKNNHLLKTFHSKIQAEVKSLNRPLLHAKELGFTHPISRKSLFFDSPLPEDFSHYSELFERYGSLD